MFSREHVGFGREQRPGSFVALLACLLGALSCDSTSAPKLGPSISREFLDSSPETLVVDSLSFVLKTYLWRNFQPVIGGGGDDRTRLIAYVELVQPDSIAVPTGVDPRYLWAMKDDEIWPAVFTYERLAPTPEFVVSRIARKGPHWETGSFVDIVVGVAVPGGGVRFISAHHQEIHRAD